MRSRKFIWQLLASLAISGVLVFFSLRHTDLPAVSRALRSADPQPILGYFGILLLVHLVKTLRWWLLLLPLGRISFKRVNAASAVGLMLLGLMPLKLGELARPLIVSRPSADGEEPLRRSAALASCVVERLVDSMAMGILAIISIRMLSASGRAADLAKHAATLMTIGFGGLCVALTLAFMARERAVALIRRLLSPLSAGVAEKVSRLIDGFILGLHLGSARNVLAFLVLTVGYWSLHVWGLWIVASAFGLPLTPLMACTVLACQVVGIMIPAGPGQMGTSQFFVQLGVSIFLPGTFTVPEVAARVAAYANSIWLLQFTQLLLTGLPFLLAGQVRLTGLFDRQPTEADLQPRAEIP